MDWDDVQVSPKKQVTVGEPLDALSITDLDARVMALDAEIVRVKAEIDRKRRQADAANAMFKT